METTIEECIPSLCHSYAAAFGASFLSVPVRGVTTEVDKSIARVDEASALMQPLRREVEEVTTSVLQTLKRSAAKLDRLFSAVDALAAYVAGVDAATAALEKRHATLQAAFSARFPSGVRRFVRSLPFGMGARAASPTGAAIAAWTKPPAHRFLFDETAVPPPQEEEKTDDASEPEPERPAADDAAPT